MENMRIRRQMFSPVVHSVVELRLQFTDNRRVSGFIDSDWIRTILGLALLEQCAVLIRLAKNNRESNNTLVAADAMAFARFEQASLLTGQP